MKIAVMSSTAWTLANFRLPLMQALARNGHEVIGISAAGQHAKKLETSGLTHLAVPFESGRAGLLRELASIWALRRIFRKHRFDLILSYTPKGNIYSALARWGLSMRQVANVSGLGSSFLQTSLLSRIVWLLYRLTFNRMDWVFFQNPDDQQTFASAGLVDAGRCECIPGSGVDLQRFTPAPLPAVEPIPVFLMVSRLLYDKGVAEFVDAARLVRREYPAARFRLLGGMAAHNPSAIAPETLQGWIDEGTVEYLGFVDDVRPALARASCVVLPSYREGLPRSLLEAAAMGRPLIAADVPGCREVVRHGSNGWLCEPRNSAALAQAMLRVCHLKPAELEAAGAAARLTVENEFSEAVVIDRYRAVIRTLCSRVDATASRQG